jgi:ribosome biogenesis GTPase A
MPRARSAERDNDLRDYVRAKQAVAELIRGVRDLSRREGDSSRTEAAEGLLVKLAEDRFNLAVVGQFKRGKSTLMNALIGRDLLPTGVLPLTSAITTLCYGPKERIRLRRRGWSMEQEIGRDQLADFVTERGNPGNEKGLIEAKIELPNRFLRRGLHFIDTPGVGSARSENTATTYDFLPNADAVIFVTSVDAPLGEIEEGFLRDIAGLRPRLFVVANKIDLVSGDERAEVLDYLASHLRAIVGDELRLYAVSAAKALSGAVHNDEPLVGQSGLPELSAALATYLANEQGRVFLIGLLEKALALLDAGRPAGAAGQGARSETDQLAKQAYALLDRLARGGSLAVEASSQTRDESSVAVIEQATKTPPDARQSQTLARLRPGTCPVCAEQGQAIFEFFARWQGTLASSDSAQRAFAAARGFCPIHTWQFSQIGSPVGLSSGYAPLVESIAAALRSLLDGNAESRAADLSGMSPAAGGCVACDVLRRTEAREIDKLLHTLADTPGQIAYEAVEGFCLPHLRAALSSSPRAELARWLVEDQVRRLDELGEDLRGYVLKREALRRGLINAREERAWRRALVALVGERTALGAPSLQEEI